MSFHIGRKGQLNRPRDAERNPLMVLQPGAYSRNDLERSEMGWREMPTTATLPQVLVSPRGEVAVRHDPSKDVWRILAQQQISPDGYLGVWLAINPLVKAESCAYLLHKLVARKWCELRTDLIYYDEGEDRVRLIGVPQVDHLDRDPTNNCYVNLEWVTSEENRRRRGGGYLPDSPRTFIDKDVLSEDDRTLVE